MPNTVLRFLPGVALFIVGIALEIGGYQNRGLADILLVLALFLLIVAFLPHLRRVQISLRPTAPVKPVAPVQPKQLAPNDVEEVVTRWLIEAGFRIRKEQRPSEHFRILAEDAQGNEIHIFLRRNENVMIAATVLQMSAEDNEMLSKVPITAYEAAVADFIAEFLKMDLSYGGFDKVPLDRVAFQENFRLAEDISSTEFIRRIGKIRRAVGIVRVGLAKLSKTH